MDIVDRPSKFRTEHKYHNLLSVGVAEEELFASSGNVSVVMSDSHWGKSIGFDQDCWHFVDIVHIEDFEFSSYIPLGSFVESKGSFASYFPNHFFLFNKYLNKFHLEFDFLF